MINKQSFVYIDVNTESVRLNLEYVDFPVLWNYKGLYGLIPYPRIKNALELWKNLHPTSNETPKGVFDWHDTIPVPLQIANTLLGEDKDDKCTYRGKSGTKSE